jgi:DNA processing protein
VLAGGFARPYPPEAAKLMPLIAETGAAISEMPIEWEPRGRDFPRRNRLVSGLALATVVVEAARGSGSLITARCAAEQNREVFAAPGSPLDPRAEGTNDLLRQGAALCARVEDVLAVVDPIRARDPFSRFAEAAGGSDEAAWSEAAAQGDGAPAPDGPPDETASAREEASEADACLRRVEALLGPAPIAVDDLARAAQAPARAVRGALVELELAGRIEHCGGDRVALVAPSQER